MGKIQRVSSLLLIVLNVLLVVIPLWVVIQRFFLTPTEVKELIANGGWWMTAGYIVETPEGSVDLSTLNWTLFSRVLFLAAGIVDTLPLFLSLFVLKLLFKNYRQGEIFSKGNALLYKYLGWLFFFDALLAKPLSETLSVLLATLQNSPGHRYIAIMFSTPNLEALFCGIIMIVISWVMLEASKLHDEQQFTV